MGLTAVHGLPSARIFCHHIRNALFTTCRNIHCIVSKRSARVEERQLVHSVCVEEFSDTSLIRIHFNVINHFARLQIRIGKDDSDLIEERSGVRDDEFGFVEDGSRNEKDAPGLVEERFGVKDDEFSFVEDGSGIGKDAPGLVEDRSGVRDDEFGFGCIWRRLKWNYRGLIWR